MYCRKCGKLLEDGDAFCVHCGEPVRKRTEEPARKSAAAHNPEFTWNVEQPQEPRKTEDIHFNWSSGNNEPTMPVEQPRPVEATQPIASAPAPAAESPLEQELFREMEEAEQEARGRREERFYTFTQKNEAFQRLLEQEYEKIRQNGTPVERPLSRTTIELPEQPVQEEPGYTAAPAAFAAQPAQPAASVPEQPVQPAAANAQQPAEMPVEPIRVQVTKEPIQALQPDEIRTIWEEIKADLDRENQKRMGVGSDTESISREAIARAEARAAMDATKAQPKEESPAKPAEPTEETKAAAEAKAAATATALTRIWEELDEDEEKPKKKSHVGLVLFLIVLILLLLVLADLVVQKFAPDTQAAQWAETAETWVTDQWNALCDWINDVLERVQ